MHPDPTALIYFLVMLGGMLAIIGVEAYVESNPAAARRVEAILERVFGIETPE